MKVYKNHVLITGSARSGSSWFSELLAQQHRYRMLFEPEHEFKTRRGKLIADQYITTANYSKEVESYLKKVFSNRVDCDWIAQNSNRKLKRHLWPFIPKKFVIKMVRGNLAANFMYQHFRMPTINIIRNPYDVLLSQSRVKFPWLYNLEHFKANQDVIELLKKNFDFTFDQKEFDDLEKLTIRWCIENNNLFKVNPIAGVSFQYVKYEDLVNDKDLFRKICEQFNLEPVADLDKRYKQPSSKTHPKSHIVKGKSMQTGFTDEEYAKINAILDQFRITEYKREFSAGV